MTNDIERADELSRNRAYMAPFIGLLILAVRQVVLANWDWEAVTWWQGAIWFVLVGFAAATLFWGGMWFPKHLREIGDDEVTRANRAKAVTRGFLAALFVAMLVFVVAPFEPLSAQEAAHLIVSVGLAGALLSFGLLETFGNG
ncbi:hypothetical protein [Alteriqipengyuania lutimaris]|uniref:DUF2178 domain-containing protein n=1 Tax=Alteriqipengyuania lutimaris TaxID=1538146 RepID=A0A395LKU9_9SPHN|nr:hypothetical protein [Alteriqipengyuania lutimaris]MBB3035475.1 small-conductance mechanosensitive channel [Alteriqipengyuania lutimaris]RDS76044.1 hypothetical protein DL238_15385 [Alteriqipengyuania lutimaris]